jgi:Sigma-70 region 2
MKKDLYQQIRNYSFNVAYFMTKNFHDAEDIAQIVCIKFLLNEDKIKKPIPWSKTVTRNEVYKLIKNAPNKELNCSKATLENFEKELYTTCLDLTNYEKLVTETDAKKLLEKGDYRIFKLWIKCNYKMKIIKKKLNITLNAAYIRIHKMKRNLRSAKLKSEGYYTSREIIDFQTNYNINKFIKKFCMKMKEKDLFSLRSYLEFIDTNGIETLDIVKYLDYEVTLKEKLVHEILVPYIDSKASVKFFYLSIKIDRKSKIKLIKFVEVIQEDILSVNKTEEKFLEMMPISEKGILPITFDEVKGMVRKK